MVLNKEVFLRELVDSLEYHDQYSPRPVLTRLQTKTGHITVVRDDLLEGGTKQRAIVPFLSQLIHQGVKQVVYASPFAGFAQVALASGAQKLGLKCLIFCEEDKTQEPGKFHKFTKIAQSFGAQVRLCKDLISAENAAVAYARVSPVIHKLPLGFDCPEYKDFLSKQLSRAWQEILDDLGHTPRNLWLPVGSGTLSQTFRKIVSTKVSLKCVNVRVLDRSDSRLKKVKTLPQTFMYQTPELFHEKTKTKPSIPSNEHYDGKLWQFIKDHAGIGDIWWNVAK